MTLGELKHHHERLVARDGGPLPRIQEEHGTLEIQDDIRLGPGSRTYKTVAAVLADYQHWRRRPC